MQVKCDFCDKTTSYGFNEKSGFGRMKATLGKGNNKRGITITSCSKHTNESTKKMEEFLKTE